MTSPYDPFGAVKAVADLIAKFKKTPEEAGKEIDNEERRSKIDARNKARHLASRIRRWFADR